MTKRLLFPVLLFLLPASPRTLWAQTDSTHTDSTLIMAADSGLLQTAPADTAGLLLPKKKKGFFYGAPDYPNPKKALVWGLVIPGGGQIYNKKWWKLPLVYGGLGAMGWAVQYNTKFYLNFKRNYRRAVRGLPHDYSDLNISQSYLKEIRDRADKRRQLSYIGFTAVYALTLADAFVDAHLAGFDVNDDLSLQLRPIIERDAFGGVVQGGGVVFVF
ncbi:MAG TPA: hypothetical protein ENJ88_11065 [Phaeodactylibacter sp.]|nr:hypothetical protein [Phaeodactylibacter sp.]